MNDITDLMVMGTAGGLARVLALGQATNQAVALTLRRQSAELVDLERLDVGLRQTL